VWWAPAESNLTFQRGEVHALPFEGCFDVVSAARVLQWVNSPAEALRQMRKAVRPGGWIVVLDYNHAANAWEPEPPASFRRFWDAFLRWRESNGWDNRMADHLPGLFAEVGFGNVEVHVDDEIAECGAEGFEQAVEIWANVIETIGPVIGVSELPETLASYRVWTAESLQRQTLCMRTVIGSYPD
jgi:SAM-dependent methyltransferase